jgi:hypothetical protein
MPSLNLILEIQLETLKDTIAITSIQKRLRQCFKFRDSKDKVIG